MLNRDETENLVCSDHMAYFREAVPLILGQKHGKGFRGSRQGLELSGAALAWSFLLGTNECSSKQAIKSTE